MFIATFTDFSTSQNIVIRNGTLANKQQTVTVQSTFNTVSLLHKGYPTKCIHIWTDIQTQIVCSPLQARLWPRRCVEV